MTLSASYLIKFLLMFLGIFVIIFIITILTPKLAAFVDKIVAKLFKKNPERVEDDIYKVKSIYDAPPKEKNEKEPDDSNKNDGDVGNG